MRDHAAILHRVVNAFSEPSDRYDLLQELTLAVWNAIPAFRGHASASTFIYRVSHNAAMMWRRSQRTYQRKIATFEAFASNEPAPEQREQDRERLECIYAAIRLLPPADRSLILLSLDGVSYRHMADIHGLSESNVGVRLKRIRERLATLLNQDPS
ncbi:MAG TPA: sigma-70 family RNA polymerase sigma factor [Chthoniobacterales bacterium]|jgi:RNA polymerase sigma-70 factor (ECF subfamily)